MVQTKVKSLAWPLNLRHAPRRCGPLRQQPVLPFPRLQPLKRQSAEFIPSANETEKYQAADKALVSAGLCLGKSVPPPTPASGYSKLTWAPTSHFRQAHGIQARPLQAISPNGTLYNDLGSTLAVRCSARNMCFDKPLTTSERISVKRRLWALEATPILQAGFDA